MKIRVFNHAKVENVVKRHLVDYCVGAFDSANDIVITIYDNHVTVLYIDSNGIAAKWGGDYDVIEWEDGSYGVMYPDFELIDTLA